MTRLIPFILLAALPATGRADEPAPSQPPAAELAMPAERYVQASRLNLRNAPGGTKVGSLTINSPVDILEVRGSDFRVRTKNDAEGWVPARFLGEQPLTLVGALAAARAAETPEDRLSWAQRATAIDARHRPALQALADAYRAVGNESSASAIDRRLVWPDDILLAGYAPQGRTEGPLALEWGTLERIHITDRDDDGSATIAEGAFVGEDCDDDNAMVYPGQANEDPTDGIDQDCDGTDGTSASPSSSRPTIDFPTGFEFSETTGLAAADGVDTGFVPYEGFLLTPADMKKRGVKSGQDVWVLPERSAAVKGTVKGLRLVAANACEERWLWVLDVDVRLPDGERPVAYTITSPPRIWKEPAPSREFEAAQDLVRAKAGPGFEAFHMVPNSDGVGVRAVRDDLPPPKVSDAVRYTINDYQVSWDGSTALLRSWVFDDWMSTYDTWWVGRDLDGDGLLERVDVSFCKHILYGADGTVLVQSALRCCSC